MYTTIFSLCLSLLICIHLVMLSLYICVCDQFVYMLEGLLWREDGMYERQKVEKYCQFNSVWMQQFCNNFTRGAWQGLSIIPLHYKIWFYMSWLVRHQYWNFDCVQDLASPDFSNLCKIPLVSLVVLRMMS